jgi:hypothetical protein
VRRCHGSPGPGAADSGICSFFLSVARVPSRAARPTLTLPAMPLRLTSGKGEVLDDDTSVVVPISGGREDRVQSQSCAAILSGAMPSFFHQCGSSRERWSSRWCNRQSGTENSSLTFRLRARFWAKRG